MSQAFQANSLAKQAELEQSIDRLKEPIDEYRLMIDAAIDACLRRRKLVFKFYETQEQLVFAAQGADSFDHQRREQHQQQTKRQEELQLRVMESTKCLDDELRLFRGEKEQQMRVLLSEFVRLQKTTNEVMKGHWLTFLQKAEAKDPQAAEIQSQLSLIGGEK